MSVAITAAGIAVGVLGALACLQIAVAAGAPWGRLVWGGAHRVLPKRLRVASGASVVLYGCFGVVLLVRTASETHGGSVVGILTWALFGYFCLGIVMNALSRSRLERAVMTPACVVLAACTLIVALS